jgi:ParB/RepB/Spo0J family partition protein
MASEGDHPPQFNARTDLNRSYALHSIALASIKFEDTTFRITTEADIRRLVVSIEQLGLLHPPALKPHDGGHRIISGFRRIAACRQLGWSEIPAFILDTQTSEGACILHAIADNSLQRPLNMVEISRSLLLLSSHFKDENLVRKHASGLGLAENDAHISKLQKICHLPKPIQNGILEDTVSFAVALDLSRLSPEASLALYQLFDQLRPGSNKQRQLVALFSEIALRENISVRDLLSEKAVREILDHPELDRVRKSRRLKNYLTQRRFPAVTQYRRQFEAQLKMLKLGNSMALAPPRDFEGNTYTLTMRFNCHKELVDLKSKFDRMVRSAGLKRFLDGKMD